MDKFADRAPGHALRADTGSGGQEGYLYVPAGGQGPATGASPGRLIQNKDRLRPWIVVHHEIESVIPAEWPGSLWRAAVVDAANQKDFDACGGGRLLPTAPYTRAVAVRVLSELPIWRIFGGKGEQVLEVVRVAEGLSSSEVDLLASHTEPGASKCYSKAWSAWLLDSNPDSIYADADHTRTLLAGGSKRRSPINAGFTLIYSLMAARARQLGGQSALGADDEGGERLLGNWAHALSALLHAAMALGAPDYVSDDERVVLLKPWLALGNG
jgi:hypothetical protein